MKLTQHTALALSQLHNVPPEWLETLHAHCPLDELLHLNERALRALETPERLVKLILAIDWLAIEQAEHWLKLEHHHYLHYWHTDYPPLLREIHTAPLGLYLKGQKNILINNKIALVGSRKPSPQGLANAGEFAESLASQGLTVVSGLAYGIDAAAHEGALKHGHTIAVLGSGLERIYPYKNKDLARKITQNGLLISEFSLNTAPRAFHFPQRNRIVCGLSLATIVIEATLKSGSLITAYLANNQGRDVFALPGSIRQPHSRGCHQLIKEGAYLAETPDDIMFHLKNNQLVSGPENQDQKLDNYAQKRYPRQRHRDPLYNKVLNALGDNQLNASEIASHAGLELEKVLVMLTELELDQYINAVAGGYRRNESPHDITTRQLTDRPDVCV
ncbi:MAG: DNA-protecting protein DprA [Gammaproteobacteria bacterium CG11_big_fil_rev_8_21_14_0_20_46_22]|nr:MAG: DNA-protecting protein DprA [Gammaproteobacteria bacterium CG12_big_fil_rev_8_21_14_0_65_46_12]PIR11950.1 MAG: DNA-protecting protein DprA [Gammaproteobacteria bacterium CG11_big_fil_rev_8_21_14_0_20_46_22]